jgi:hypothetical protein
MSIAKCFVRWIVFINFDFDPLYSNINENSTEALADSAIHLLQNPQILTEYNNKSLAFSRQFDWNKTADEFDKNNQVIALISCCIFLALYYRMRLWIIVL